MPLSRKERRALRGIEEHLAAEDPALAGLLRISRTARVHRRIREITRWVIAASVTLMVLGIVLANGGLAFGGMATLMILPVLRLLAVVIARWQ
jgi:anti-sigma factor RsiW